VYSLEDTGLSSERPWRRSPVQRASLRLCLPQTQPLSRRLAAANSYCAQRTAARAPHRRPHCWCSDGDRLGPFQINVPLSCLLISDQSIVSHFKKSPKSTSIIKAAQTAVENERHAAAMAEYHAATQGHIAAGGVGEPPKKPAGPRPAVGFKRVAYTRWNASFFVNERVLRLRAPLEQVHRLTVNNSKREDQAGWLELSEDDWVLLDGLQEILAVFQMVLLLVVTFSFHRLLQSICTVEGDTYATMAWLVDVICTLRDVLAKDGKALIDLLNETGRNPGQRNRDTLRKMCAILHSNITVCLSFSVVE
jgi:hypothetical protein